MRDEARPWHRAVTRRLGSLDRAPHDLRSRGRRRRPGERRCGRAGCRVRRRCEPAGASRRPPTWSSPAQAGLLLPAIASALSAKAQVYLAALIPTEHGAAALAHVRVSAARISDARHGRGDRRSAPARLRRPRHCQRRHSSGAGIGHRRRTRGRCPPTSTSRRFSTKPPCCPTPTSSSTTVAAGRSAGRWPAASAALDGHTTTTSPFRQRLISCASEAAL